MILRIWRQVNWRRLPLSWLRSWGRPLLILAVLVAAGSYVRNEVDRRLPPDASRIYSQALVSTVLVRCGGAADSTTRSRAGAIDSTEGFGTGFYVSPHLLVTCAHITNKHRRCRISTVFTSDDSVVSGRVLFADSLRDIAVIFTETAASPLRLRSTEPDIGETIFAIGNPHGYLGSLSGGVVSLLLTDPDKKRDLVQCSSLMEPGGSGGPLLDRYGEVLGITSFGSEDANFTFGVNAETIRSVLVYMGLVYRKCRDDPRAALETEDADSTWTDLHLSDADLAVLDSPSGGLDRVLLELERGQFDWYFFDRVIMLNGLTPIFLLLLALVAVLARRRRRLRRLARRHALRLELEALRSHAFLPDQWIEKECARKLV